MMTDASIIESEVWNSDSEGIQIVRIQSMRVRCMSLYLHQTLDGQHLIVISGLL